MQTALDFAVASAQERGWVVAAIGPQGAAFEQWLEESAEGEVLESIRVYADLVEESGGIRVSLRADRIEAPGTDREWLWDVTGAYADNLTNALASLRARWDLHRADSGSAPNGIASADPARERWSTPPPGAVGTWAYYAEAHAARLGCELTDRGAVLVAAGDGWEDHRVPCLDGSERRILCRHGECTAARRR